MKRLIDVDEFGQGIPKSKKMSDLESHRLLVVGVKYVTKEEFNTMQTDLKNQLAEQTTVLEQALLELKQVKLHLASLSGENIEAKDVEE